MEMVTRVEGNKEGNGKGGKKDGNSNKEGNGKGSKSDGMMMKGARARMARGMGMGTRVVGDEESIGKKDE
jgi:hypothetical protein